MNGPVSEMKCPQCDWKVPADLLKYRNKRNRALNLHFLENHTLRISK